MGEIDLNSFLEFCKKRVGQTLCTADGKAQFSIEDVSEKAFHYKVSKNVVRKQAIRYVERILERYSKIQSFNPGHYANISPNAVYVLALIQMWEERAGVILERSEESQG